MTSTEPPIRTTGPGSPRRAAHFIICSLWIVVTHHATAIHADDPPTPTPIATGATNNCGDGMCRASEALACPADCRNLVRNGRFDDGVDNWRATRSHAARTDGEGHNRFLRLENRTGGDLSVSQKLTIGGEHDACYVVGYRVKALSLPKDGTITLDAVVQYADGKNDFIIAPFKVGPQDIGHWRARSTELPRGRAIQSIKLILFANGQGASACFDDLVVAKVDDTAGFAFSTRVATAVVNETGMLVSVRSGDRELLRSPEPLALIEMQDGSQFPSRTFERIEGDAYRMTFGECPIELRATITSHDRYVAFNLIGVTDVDERVRRIDLFRIRPGHIPQRQEDMDWAIRSPSNEVFFNAVPLDANALCYADGPRLVCRFSPFLGWTGGGALIATTKAAYWDALEDVAREQPVPYVKTDDGKWFRKSTRLRDSYLFPTLTPENADQMLDYAKRGGFRDVLIHEVYKGTYDKPIHFESLDALKIVADRFKAAGIAVNLHVFANQVEQQGNVVDFTQPAMSLADVIYSIPVGALSADIDASDRVIPLDRELDWSHEFQHYAKTPDGFSFGTMWDWGLFLIDNEIVRCKGCDGDSLSRALRGAERTTAAAHRRGAEIRYIPRTAGYFINPENTTLRRRSVEGMRRTLDAVGANCVYFDGFPFLNHPGMDAIETHALMHKIGILPYVEANPPIMAQLGGTSPPMAWFYAGRVATDDAPIFRNNQFVREHKVRQRIAEDHPFDQTMSELGWWKLNGAAFDRGYDHDAVTMDDVHYVMGKVLAYDIPVGLQLGFEHERLTQSDAIFDLMGRYHALRDAYRKAPLIPQALRNWLRNPDAYAELSAAPSWHLVRKATQAEYLAWDQGSAAEFVVENAFAGQAMQFELRPRPDYVGLDAPGNHVILDRRRPAIRHVEIDGEGIECKIENDGWISIRNSGNLWGSCRLMIDGEHTINHRRGIGIRMTGDRRKSLVIVSCVQNGFARRDYKLLVDFQGERDVILGSPTTDEVDVVDGEIVTPRDVSKPRHWELTLDRPVTFEIQIQNIAPHSQMRLQFKKIVAMEEKHDSPLVNPVVTVGEQSLKFPLTLKLSDRDGYALQYDGRTGAYRVLSSNREILATGETDKVRLEPGRNRLRVTSDTSEAAFGSRAELIVHLYDDQDGDGVPDDGDLSPNGRRCSGVDQFCDDNCPAVWNPDQVDTDGDGIGDACDSVENE